MIHKTAVIDPGAVIGNDVQIGPYCVIENDVVIGDGCILGPHVCVMRYTTLGPKCRVHAGAVLGDLPQDLGFAGSESRVTIGAGCVFREGVTVHRGTKPGTVTEIGDSCFLMANSHVAHNCRLGKNVIMVNGSLLGGYVEVGDRAFLGGNCGVHQFTRVGRMAMIGGASGISKDIPPFCMMHTVRFNVVSGLNVVGMRRGGLTSDDRMQVKEAFRILYRSGRNVSQALAEMKPRFTTGPAAEFIEFVATSKRGICAMEESVGEAEAE